MIDFNYLKAKAQELFSKGVALVAKHAKVALLVLLGLLLLVLVQCAKAENAPASNFGMIRGIEGTVFACYVSDEKKGPTVDAAAVVIHTCLILQDLGSGLYGTQGMVTFCGQTGLHSSGQPMFSCGEYNDIKEQMRGI